MSPPDRSIEDRSLSEPIIPKPCIPKKPSLFRDIPILIMMASSTTIIPVKIPVFLSIFICISFSLSDLRNCCIKYVPDKTRRIEMCFTAPSIYMAAAKPSFISFLMSSIFSSPMLTRTIPGVMPASICSSGFSCEWVVDAG